MSENQPEPEPEIDDDGLAHTPDDTAEAARRGYAVYDRQLGRYVTGVTADKPKVSDARKTAGHDDVAIVAV